MASTNWNNITNTVLKGTIALSLITISGCVVPVTYKTYRVLNDVQNVTKDVRYAARTMGNRVNRVSGDDINSIMKSVSKLLDALNNATEETMPAIKNAILNLLKEENIDKVLSALDSGYAKKLIEIAYRHPGLTGLLEKCVGIKPVQPSLQESVGTTASNTDFSEKTESDSNHGIQKLDEGTKTDSSANSNMSLVSYLWSWLSW